MILIESENDLHHKVVSLIRKKYNNNCLMITGLGEFQTTSMRSPILYYMYRLI